MSAKIPRENAVEGLDEVEHKDAVRRSAPKAAVVYEAIRREGEDELARDTAALVWSGLAAGLSMGFSFLMEALLAHHLPDGSWNPLISKLGYSIGFLIVILGRQQLFTENTLTPILHLLQRKDRGTLMHVARLWTTVFSANIVGALIFALLMQALVHFRPELSDELDAIARQAYGFGFVATLLSGLFAGWLIALMVWLLPFAETGRVTIIILITYVVGLGGFAHIVAGSVDAFFILAAGKASLADFFVRFFIPTLLGNIIGGVAFVTAINHAQVSRDRKRGVRGSHP